MKRWPTFLVLACLVFLSVGTSGPQRLSLEPPEALRGFVNGNTDFALAIYAKLAPAHSNLFLSPYSLSAALAVAHAGAQGETQAQMSRALSFPTNQTELRTALARQREALARIGKRGRVQLNSATGLWVQKDYGFEQRYLDLVHKSYDSRVEFVDFTDRSHLAARQIEAWITQQTRGRIVGGMAGSVLTPTTRLVIADAMYFKGDWASRFAKSATRDQRFWVSGTASVDAAMMRQEHDFVYADGDGAQLVELPYVGRELSMIVLLPKERDGLAELEQNLDASHLRAWADTLGVCKVDLELPRFKVASSLSLGAQLQALGMTDAFDERRADFTGMSRRRPLFIQAVEQSSVVEVNEEGTEAASATQISFGCASVAEPPRRQFHADHPFLFFIRENQTGAILFLGRVADPTR